MKKAIIVKKYLPGVPRFCNIPKEIPSFQTGVNDKNLFISKYWLFKNKYLKAKNFVN